MSLPTALLILIAVELFFVLCWLGWIAGGIDDRAR